MTDQPEPTVQPGPINEILTRLSDMEANIETLETHLKTKMEQYEYFIRAMNEFMVRLDVVERKTFSLADRPGQMNCPSCGRKIANPQSGKCGICGSVFPQ